MANTCDFLMKVRGNRDDIEQFYKALNQNGKIWVGRGAETDINFREDGAAFMLGLCKWSVLSSLVDNAILMRTEPDKWFHKPDEEEHEYITLWEACKKWNLIMEVYSEESGCEFQEHFICDKGDVICNECVEWHEYCICDYETKEEAEKELGLEILDEEWEGEEWIHRGGFGDWVYEI